MRFLVAMRWLIAGLIGALMSCAPATKATAPASALVPGAVVASSDNTAKHGQTVYVPVYSHVAVGDRAQPYALAITLSARNTDRVQSITVISARYFDSKGRMIRNFAEKPVALGPMASVDYFIEESDKSGGSSASFLVEWVANAPVGDPIFEAVMVGTRNQQGVSFTSYGRVVEDRAKLSGTEP